MSKKQQEELKKQNQAEHERILEQESVYSAFRNAAQQRGQQLKAPKPYNLESSSVDMGKMKEHLKKMKKIEGYKFEENPKTGQIKAFSKEGNFLFEYGKDLQPGNSGGGFLIDPNNPESIKAAAAAHMATNPTKSLGLTERTDEGMNVLETFVNDTQVKLSPASFKGWGKHQDKADALFESYQNTRGLEDKPAMTPKR